MKGSELETVEKIRKAILQQEIKNSDLSKVSKCGLAEVMQLIGGKIEELSQELSFWQEEYKRIEAERKRRHDSERN